MTNRDSAPDPEGREGAGLTGIANEHSIAWGCAKAFRELGAELAITYLNEKTRGYVEPLARDLGAPIFMPLDVTQAGRHRRRVRADRHSNGAGSISWCTRSPGRRRKTCRAACWTARPRASAGDGHLLPLLHPHGAPACR
jgi:hypothetical protein